MWTGETNLRSIHNYVSGYYHALIENNIVQSTETEKDFFDWVAKKLGYFESTAGWVNMIVAFCVGFDPKNISWKQFFSTPISHEQHLKSIRYFYELIDEFKANYEAKAFENSA